MKCLAAIILSALLLFSLVACGLSSNTDETTDLVSSETASKNIEKSVETPSLSKQEIMSSVLSSIESSFNTENTNYTTYNFIDDQIGYFFFFGIYNGQNRLILFMKTIDGGKTWSPIISEKTPSTNWKETIICAKMVNESVGMISGKFYADNESIARRLFITTNEGITWHETKISSIGHSTGNSEAYDIKYENGQYIVYFRELDTTSEHQYKYFEYTSTDLKNWVLVDREK